MEWLRKECDCLEHVTAKLWYEATGDSYVVDAREVMGARGAAVYLAKYLTKSAMSFDRLEDLGFKRRWSRSRNWPGGEKLQLRQTVEGGWAKIVWSARNGSSDREEEWARRSEGHGLGARIGDNLSFSEDERKVRLAELAQVERITNAIIW